MCSAEIDLVVSERFRIPADELSWSFGPSGGPGGQHANRSNTRAELRFDLARSDVFPADLRQRILERIGGRAPGGVVTVVADESRSQWRNRTIARRRMAELLAEALRQPATRRPTRPTRASQRRRLERKRARSELKRLRRRPSSD